MTDLPTSNIQMLTLITPEGKLHLSLADAPVQAPREDQVVVKVLQRRSIRLTSGCWLGLPICRRPVQRNSMAARQLRQRFPPLACAQWLAVWEKRCQLAMKPVALLLPPGLRLPLKP